MILQRSIHRVRAGKWEERNAQEKRAAQALARIGIPPWRRYATLFGSLPLGCEIVEREWETLTVMESGMARRMADPEHVALIHEAEPLLISSQTELYKVLWAGARLVEAPPQAHAILQREIVRVGAGQWDAFVAHQARMDASRARLGYPPHRRLRPMTGGQANDVEVLEREWPSLEAWMAQGVKAAPGREHAALMAEHESLAESIRFEVYQVLAD
jgi:hypothetical protein